MELLGRKPGRKLIGYFAGAIALGTVLLSLPISSTGEPLGVVDALFTATSAVCVTGLIVVDTATAFTTFGQVVILTLLQLGGLGIMTFATALLLSITPRVSFRDSLVLSESLAGGRMFRPHSVIRAVLTTTLVVEAAGAVALFFSFRGRFPVDEAIYHAIFHAISAFCNAGFSTFSTSLENYSSDPYTLLVFSVLIVLGGLGFVAISELVLWRPGKRVRLSLHTKLCLTSSAVLVVAGTVAFLFSERLNVFTHMNTIDTVVNALFQSVTARTAGFNSIPQGNLTEISVLVTMILMFIGACPGSTGGGTKTTTTSIIVLLAFNRLIGRRTVAAFKRSIAPDSIWRAMTVVMVASIVIAGMFVALMLAEERPVPHQLSQGWFVDSLFEVISAFGTVGLSLGTTNHLSDPGKVIISTLMFVGRVGLLTLLFALARVQRPGEVVYPDEQVMVG